MLSRDDINKAVGQAIKEERQKKNLSQEKMALLANIDRTYASALERGIKNPSIEVILKISKGLDCPSWEIVQRIEEILNNYN